MADARHPTHPSGPPRIVPGRTAATDQLAAFLTDRLREELAALLERGGSTAAMLAVLDEQLLGLADGRLPEPRELRLLLWAYGGHPDYDPAWTDLLR
ncbi:hypothetical protein [Nocardioides flavescens]|uniref:Uncharacterized protein n=1 Tax=Nocardioides flavescens TaxID=2691959 RepID=A0A6L7F1A0_9ACTN|nr:hypothetical protein [Nocardioides flavescens]MXG90551.1 hypothetical protein [Nocardioides flavescens]